MLQQVNSNSNPRARVVTVAKAAVLLGVSERQVGRYLKAGHLEPWFAPLITGKRRRRMVIAASIDALLRRGEV